MKSSLNTSRFTFIYIIASLHHRNSFCSFHKKVQCNVLVFSLLLFILKAFPAQAAPAIDADSQWGRGAQLSLVNPAHIQSIYGRLNFNYDLIIPDINNVLDPQAQTYNEVSWGHELSLGFGLGKRYTVATSYFSLPYNNQSNVPTNSNTHFDQLKFWSFAQALKLSDRFSFGLTYIHHAQQKWLSGLSYGFNSWLLGSISLAGMNKQSLQQGLVSFGLGLKPIERWSLGLQVRPRTGGGRMEVSTQLRLWRGLHLELAGQANQGSGLTTSSNPILVYHDLHQAANDQQNLSFRFALAWRGLSTWRLESGARRQDSARISLRFESQSSPKFELQPVKKLIMVNARDSRELSYKNSLFSSGQARSPFFDTLRKLEEIKTDPAAKVVLLLLGGPMAFAQAEELIASIEELRLKGLIVYAYLPQANLANYLVAASCDIIWTSPTSELSITGILSERLYFKNLLNRLNIVPEVLTVGDYKSAPEIFLRSEPSKEASEVDEALLDARFSNLIKLLAHRAQQQRWAKEPSPSLSKGKRLIALRKLKDHEEISREDKALAITWLNEGPYGAQHAYKSGLVDKIISPSELEEQLKKTHPRLKIEFKELNRPSQTWAPKPQIAIIHAVGEIGGGLGLGKNDSVIRASDYVPLIKKLTFDPMVKAAVLRIDSPGGAVGDADAIWHVLKNFAKRKPLAVSMGSVAASGGYYIAAPGHMLFANTNTFTGSIGVFAGKVDLSALLETYGINIHRQNRGNAVSRSLLSPWSDQAKRNLQKEIDQIYELFLSRITTVRKSLDHEKLLPLAGGRVWTGEDAKNNGLVDVKGGLIDALKWVSAEARLTNTNYQIRSYAPPKSSLANKVIGTLGLSSFQKSFILNSKSEPVNTVSSLLLRSQSDQKQTWWALFNELPTSLRFILSFMMLNPNQALAIDPRL
ncbi:MAG: hypothetical protein CMH49_04815 [Myxococcales bacterium]|nr:hypothetical protein [Myxococcales bacterium]